MEPRYISEEINNDYEKWRGRSWELDEELGEPSYEGDYVLIEADMGTGKTSFIFNVLAQYAEEIGERILYLCNRIELKEDAINYSEHSNFNSVDIMSYQQLEKIIEQKNRSMIDPDTGESNKYSIDSYSRLLRYKYIVADECHYFLEDSQFNAATHYSFSFLTKKSPQVKILISATPGMLRKVFYRQVKQSGYKYRLKKNMEYLHLQFYRDDRGKGKDYPKVVIENLLSQDTEEKIIYFVDSKKRMTDLLTQSSLIKENAVCLFSGDDETEDGLIKADNCIERISEDYITFSSRVLLTTTVISNGVSFKDKNIKWIICDIPDPLTAVQCIGRKRVLDNEDSCNVLVRYYLKEEFFHKKKTAACQVRLTEKFLRDPISYANEIGNFAKEKSTCLYTDWHNEGKISVNWPKYFKFAQDDAVYSRILRYNDEAIDKQDTGYGYCQFFMNLCGITECSPTVNYYVTEEELCFRQQELLIKLAEFVKEHLDEKIYLKSELGEPIKATKINYNQLQKQMGKKALKTQEIYELICDMSEGQLNYTVNSKMKTYVQFSERNV